MRTQTTNWAVFLDRDGTINEEVEILSEPERLVLLPGAADAIRLLNQARVPAVLVTNQSAIGRGFFPATRLAFIHHELSRQLGGQGAHLDAMYYCPHLPGDGCACRKPQPGMLKHAAREFGVDLTASFVVGDKLSDLEAGRRAGCRAVLVLTGYGSSERASLKEADPLPDHVSPDLLDAVRWILAGAEAPLDAHGSSQLEAGTNGRAARSEGTTHSAATGCTARRKSPAHRQSLSALISENQRPESRHLNDRHTQEPTRQR